MEEKRLVVKFGHYTGFVYFHNLLCFRNNDYEEVKKLIGQTIPVYFLKKEDKDGSLLFSQTCTFAYERKECDLANIVEGQTIECIPTTYIFKYGVFVNFNQGTGLIHVSKIDNWDLLYETYPIGQPISLVVKNIDIEKNEIRFYPKTFRPDSDKQDLTSCQLEVGKRYQVKIIWLENDVVKVSFENGIERIPMDLFPKLFRKNIFKLKNSTQDILIDAVAIEKDGQKVLSVIDAINLDYENLSPKDKAYGLKTVEVLWSDTKKREERVEHFIIVRWKGLYGFLAMDDETLKTQGYEMIPQSGSFIDLKVVGYNPEKQIILRPKEVKTAEKKTSVGKEKKDITIDISDPSNIQTDLYPIYVIPNRLLVSDELLAIYEDKYYLVKLNLPDLSFINLLMKWVRQDSCKFCIICSEKSSDNSYLIWDGCLNDADIRSVANHEIVEVTVQNVSKNYVIFYVGRMIGCIFLEELNTKGIASLQWGDKIRVRYTGRLVNGNQHLLFQFVSVCDRSESENVPLPIIKYDANTDFSTINGFVISCITKSVNEDVVIFNSPKQDWIFKMSQAEWDETGLPLPRQLGYETIPIYLGIQQGINETRVLNLSRKVLFTDMDYKWYDEEESGFPQSVISGREEKWRLWREGVVDGEIQEWLVWRVQNEWAFFRKGELILPVKREKIDYALGTYSKNILVIGQPVSFLIKVVEEGLPYQMLLPVEISEQEYTSRLPHVGDFVLCQIIKKGPTEWRLSGQQWIGVLPIEQIPEECNDIKEFKSVPLAVIGYNPTTRDVVCSFRAIKEQIREDVVLDNCIVSRNEDDGLFVNYNGIDIPVGKMKKVWKRVAMNNLFKVGDIVKTKVKKVRWNNGKFKVTIIGNKSGLFCNLFPAIGSTVIGIITNDIKSLEEDAYIIRLENGGVGLMEVNESMETIDSRLRYNIGEKVEVAVIGYDQESGLPLLSYNRCHSIQFDTRWFVPDQSYQGRVVRFCDEGVTVSLTLCQARIFIPIRLVYNHQSDYKKRLYQKDSSISVIYKGSQTFIAETIQTIDNPPAKGESCKLTILSICESGINTWDGEGRLVWIPINEICFKKEIDINGMSYKKNDLLDGYYLKKNLKTVYLTATLKQNRDISIAYPVGTCLEGRICEILFDKKHYIVDLGDVWGDLDMEDVSWYSDVLNLEVNQLINVKVIRKPLPGNILCVSMLSSDILGPIGSSLKGTVLDINNDNIIISINGIKTLADKRKAQDQIGIDNFGMIKLHIGDNVLVTLDSVNISNKIIRVVVESLIQ